MSDNAAMFFYGFISGIAFFYLVCISVNAIERAWNRALDFKVEERLRQRKADHRVC